MKADTSFRARARAHSLLLSDQGTPIKDIAKTYHVDRDTVSSWITQWEHHGAQSLHDKPRSGRPSKLTPEEQALAQQYIKEEPRALKGVVERLATKTAKRISISSLKRLAKKARLRWKRVRKSLKRLREPEAFARCQRELEALQHQEDTGKIDLYYFDESGFALDPSPFNMVIFVQEAWQSRYGVRSDRACALAAFSWDREDASDISPGLPRMPTHAMRLRTPALRGRETAPSAGPESQSSSRHRSG